MSMELSTEDPASEDVASKFFEHFVAIADAMNTLGGTGLWNEEDGFYYDQILLDGRTVPLRVRSIAGLTPLLAVTVLHEEEISLLPGFQKRMLWFLENRKDLAHVISCMDKESPGKPGTVHRLLSIPSRERLIRMLRYALDENEFLSPYGIRSLSKAHAREPYVLDIDGERRQVSYCPGDSDSYDFGGNSNWRGPVWFPLNYLFIEALECYDHFYGDRLRVECPTGSGRMRTLKEVAEELTLRLARVFLRGPDGRRPCHGDVGLYAEDPHWRDLVLFYECFHGDNGRGIGASHQTGWTALATRLLEDVARLREGGNSAMEESDETGIR
jgi:hypothetical protein